MTRFRWIRRSGCFLSALLVVSAARAGSPALTPAVQGVLDRHCVKCHGPLEQNAGLRLDSAKGLWKGTGDGPVAVAGKPDESKLIRVLAAGSDPHMPPMKQLAETDIAGLRSWLSGLADVAEAQPARATTVSIPADPTSAIDHFLAAGWQARKVSPAPLCDDRTFVRRVMLDLVGRIPTPQETDAFL